MKKQKTTPPAVPKPPKTAEEQVHHVVRMMLNGEWRGGQSRVELADLWGVHERTVGDRAMAASCILAMRGTPIEQLIDDKLAQLDRVADSAMAGMRKDHKAAIMAIRLQMEIRGVLTKQRPKDDPKPAAEGGVDALLRSVVDDPTLREKLQAMLAGKAKEMH